MRNLKKVLALVMTFAMAFSMMAGAAFTDQADIKTADAVDKLVALNIIKGNPDGSFKPEAAVTRAEMAKMIYTVRNSGNDNADGYSAMPTSFKDITGHWAAGYIKYCQSLNIIAGKSATQFDPDAAVTGTEAAKMLLVCAGYTADKAGLTGSGWDQKTLALSSESGLMDDVTASMAAGLPRQYTAQMISNALDMDTVSFNGNSGTFEKKESTKLEWKANPKDDTDGQWVNVSANESVGKKYMGLSTREGGILESINKEDSKETFRVETTADTYTKVSQDYSSLMGQKVNVLVKDDKTDKVYGIYAADSSKVIATGSVNDMGAISDTAKVKVDGTEYKLDGEIAATSGDKFVPVYNTNTSDASAASIDALIKAATTADKKAASVKLIDNNDNGKIDRVIVTPVTVKKVTYVGTTSITAGSSYKFDDEAIYDGVAKDDWAVIVGDKNNADGKVHITKADVVTGKVTGTKTNGGKISEVKIDDKWYDVVDTDFNNGSTYDCVVVGGIVFDAQETVAGGVKSIVYLSALDNDGKAKKDFDGDPYLKAKAYFTDGTSKTIKITKYNGVKLTDKQDLKSLAQQILTYTTTSSENYELKQIKTGNMAGYDAVLTGGWNSGKIANKSLDNESVVFAQAGTDVKVLSGKTVKDWPSSATSFGAGMALTKEKSGITYAQVAAVYDSVGSSIPGASGDYSYGYVLEAYNSNKDGDAATYLKVWTGSEEKEMYVEGNDKGIESGDAIAYAADGKWVKTNISNTGDVKINVEKAAITGYQNKSEGEVEYLKGDKSAGTVTTLDSKAAFVGAKTKDTVGDGGDMGSVQLAEQTTKDGKTTAKVNAYIFHDGSDIFAIVYDTNNEWDGAGSYTVSETAPVVTTINAVTLAAPAAPVKTTLLAAIPTTAPVSSTVGVKVSAITWTETTNVVSGTVGTVEAGDVYTATVTLTHDANYVFTTSTAVAGSATATATADSITVTYAFTIAA